MRRPGTREPVPAYPSGRVYAHRRGPRDVRAVRRRLADHDEHRAEHGTPLVGFSRLGVDETAFRAANVCRSTLFVTAVVHFTRPVARLLDVRTRSG